MLACQEKLTKTQWEQKYYHDTNEVNSILQLTQGEALIKEKVAESAQTAALGRWLILGIVGGIAGLIVLAYLGLAKLSFIAIADLAGCIGGLTFLKMDATYPKFLPIVGVILIIGSVGAAVVYYVKHAVVTTALTDVVKNVETIKSGMVTEPNKTALQTILQKQADTTKVIIADIRSKL